MQQSSIKEKLDEILKYLQITAEEPLSINEVCKLTKLQKSTVYKLTSSGSIPHHKLSGGKRLIFKRSEIMEWIFTNKQESTP